MPVFVLRMGVSKRAPASPGAKRGNAAGRRRESERPRSLAATFRNGERRVIAFEARRDADEFARRAGAAARETMHVEMTTLGAIVAAMGAARVGVDICSAVRGVAGSEAAGGHPRIRIERALVLTRDDAVEHARAKLERDARATEVWFGSPDDAP